MEPAKKLKFHKVLNSQHGFSRRFNLLSKKFGLFQRNSNQNRENLRNLESSPIKTRNQEVKKYLNDE